MLHVNNRGNRIADTIIHVSLLVVAMFMLFPFIYVLLGSFTSFQDFAGGGVIVIPKEPSLEAYRYVLSSPSLMQSIGVSMFLASVGTLIKLAMTATMAYALASKHLVFRRFFLLMVLIPMLFWPGIIPRFLVVRETGLLNTLWALIFPSAIDAFYLLVMRNFFMDLPIELFESAELDGANDLTIFTRIVLPLSKPILAAIGLFYAVLQWNLYFAAILYIRTPELWPVQVLLRQILILGEGNNIEADVVAPAFSMQMATVMVATVPIIILYPFLQRYFVKGVLTGAIKG
ncbi:MAG: ABC transporter permease [Anaerolineaceae bacterium]|nr:ABC transporter permease [Anaerolineaceae bacterium]